MPLSVKKRNDVILESKKIISFCKNGYDLKKCLFNSEEEIFNSIDDIKEYGDISSVRRAVKLINEKYKKDIQCKISEEVKEELELKKKIKEYSVASLQVKKGNFRLSF